VMKRRLTDEQLSALSGFVGERLGLSFPKDRWQDLERGVLAASAEFGFKDPSDCADRLLSSTLTPKQAEILAGSLTIGETYFFRDTKVFEALEKKILPELIRLRRDSGRKELRIWSAGCATGEEPYSIAMLLYSILPDIEDWRLEIMATDVNAGFLTGAVKGTYSEWSFRGTPDAYRERYFRKTGAKQFAIASRIRKMVEFFYLNLAVDPFPSFMNKLHDMDIVLCRNVFIYFTDELRKKVASGFHRTLAEGGWLIVSPSETSVEVFKLYSTVNLPGAIFYGKGPLSDVTSDPSSGQYEAGNGPSDGTALYPDAEESDIFAGYETAYAYTDGPVFETTASRVDAPPSPTKAATYEEALACFNDGRSAEAAVILGRRIREAPEDSEALMLLARIYANEGKLSEAGALSCRATAADKTNPSCHFLHATILQEQGRVEDAIGSLKKVIYLDRDFVLGHLALGNLLTACGRRGESSRCFRNAFALLKRHGREDEVPGSEGMKAGSLLDIVQAALAGEKQG